jgi:RNA polymerase sigma-70 factor (ECF subfamily)
LKVLDPDVVVHIDEGAASPGSARVVHGAQNWAKGAVAFAAAFAHVTRFTTSALIDGKIGVIAAPDGHLLRALSLKIKDGKITEIEIIGDRAHLDKLDLAVLSD